MDLLEISAKLVAKSIIGGSGLAIAQMPEAIKTIYAKLRELAEQENTSCTCQKEEARQKKKRGRPKEGMIVCLECGKKVKVLTYTHLLKEHGLTIFEYKRKHALPARYSLACHSLRRRRSQALKARRAGKC